MMKTFKSQFYSIKIATCLLVIAYSVTSHAAPAVQGKVVKVLDGDTIEILVDQKPVRIRLYGIDCPERGQPFGKKAKDFVLDLVGGKLVRVNWTQKDRYKRVIGTVMTVDGKSLNLELVKEGLAWWYRQYAPHDEDLKVAESQARKAKRGLWQDKKPMAPWEWRRR